MRKLWADFAARAGMTGDTDSAFDDLDRRYRQPHRHYHTWAHIAQCLQQLRLHRGLARDPEAVELALWYHDAVYDTRAHDNETVSAVLMTTAAGALGIAADRIRRAEAMILATTHQAPPADPDAQLTVDIDLYSLAVPDAEFDRNSVNVRKEYEWVPWPDYCAGRIQIFDALLHRSHIYCTQTWRDLHEAAARANLKREIQRLSQP